MVYSSASSKKQPAGTDKWALIRTLAQTYGLEILEALEEKPLRYTDLTKYGHNERTRSQRLKKLEDLGLISTASLKVNKRNFVHYELTDKGRQVMQRIKEIIELE
jgi:DNA-binding HxlR family transcriptional regulator